MKWYRRIYLKFRISLAIAAHGGLDPTFAPTEGWNTIEKWEKELLKNNHA